MDHPIPSKKPKLQEDSSDTINQQNEQQNSLETCGESSLITQEKLQLSDLETMPYELIMKIFEYLHPNDLATMSLTSRKGKQLAISYFTSDVRCGKVKINLRSNGTIGRWGNCEKYEKRFGSLIKEIHLLIQTIQSNAVKNLFEKLKLNCAQNIHRLILIFIRFNESPERQMNEFELIADQLMNLKLLFLSEPPRVCDILKHCENLEVLCVIRKSIEQADNDNWTQIVQSKLKVFIFADLFCNEKFDELHLIDPQFIPKPIDLTNFFLNTTNLQAVALTNFRPINSFLNSDRKVLYAAFRFDYPTALTTILDDIERCYEQNLIDTLHLGIYKPIGLVKILNRIRYLENIKGVYVRISHEQIFKSLAILPHVEVFCFSIHIYYNSEFVNRLPVIFPNLKELHMRINSIQNPSNLKQIIKSIACQHSNLKQFYVDLDHIYYDLISNDDLIEINLSRIKLNKPSSLTIQLNSDVIETNLEFISIKNVKQSDTIPCNRFTCISSNFYKYEDASKYLKTLPITYD